MRIGYARVSTKEQSFDVQIDALNRAGCDEIYREVCSGAHIPVHLVVRWLRCILIASRSQDLQVEYPV
jgi:DNA invertase Pin-like site-specific DNA recombinase